MTPAQLDLARRLVARPKWRWVAGMLPNWTKGHDGPAAGTLRVQYVDVVDGVTRVWLRLDMHDGDVPIMLGESNVPDLADFTTAAILMRVAIEAGALDTGEYFVQADSDDPSIWAINFSDHNIRSDLGTVATTALLAAWGDPG